MSCGRRCCGWSPRRSSARAGWVTEQYDRFVLGGTVLAMPHDGGVVRLGDETTRGIALALDGNGRFARLDPHDGAQLDLAEAYRNVACTGATPLAVTDCLNFGSPEDPAVMWQFAEATRGPGRGLPRARYAGDRRQRQLLQPDRRDRDQPDAGHRRTRGHRRRRSAGAERLRRGRARTWCCSARPPTSSTARPGHGSSTTTSVAGRPPSGSRAEQALAAAARAARRDDSLITRCARPRPRAASAQALVEAALLNGVGATVAVDGDPFVALFSESRRAGARHHRPTATPCSTVAADLGVPAPQIGVTGGDACVIDGSFDVSLAELRAAFEGTLPALFG